MIDHVGQGAHAASLGLLPRQSSRVQVYKHARIQRLPAPSQVASLRQQLQEARDAAAAARQQAEEAAQHKVAALVRVSEAEGGRARADRRIGQLSKELEAVKEQLEQAKQEKLAALMRAAEAQAADSGRLRGDVASPERTRTDSAKSDGSPVKPSPQTTPQKKGGGWWGGTAASPPKV